MVGVKNANGKVIIPPRSTIIYFPDNFKQPITDSLIFMALPDNEKREPHSWGVVYNRKGKRLFTPLMYDNGPDPFCEGLMRFIQNGKIGFANRHGDIVIEAKYDFAESFNYGIASFCTGCVWKARGEHEFVSGGTTGYINIKGDTIIPQTTSSTAQDQLVKPNLYLPYQFTYSPSEKKMLQMLYAHPEIDSVYFANIFSALTMREKQLRFEIVERPSTFYPYYHIAIFSFEEGYGYHNDALDELAFYYDAKGLHCFVFGYDQKKIPFDIWLKKQIKNAKDYLKKHPDAPNRF